jgi:homoserine/homoserine lactone efflux protein
MTLRTWLLFCATEAVLCAIPGPAVLCVVSQAIARGARAGVMASAGILAANVLYFALSATGVGAVLAQSTRVFLVVKWLGAVYLVWLGLRMIIVRGAQLSSAPPAPPSDKTAFAIAAMTQGANPKALIFFVAILPQFISTASAAVPQILILGVTSIVIEFAILTLYVATCHAARGVMVEPRFATTMQRAGGACLVLVGAVVVASCGGGARETAQAIETNLPACRIQARAFRSGLEPPAIVRRVEPELAGLEPLPSPQIAIVEVRIDEHGAVTDACLRRGVRPDVDPRVLDAVRAWQFEPPRLSAPAGTGDQRLEAGTAVPVIMTVTVKVAASGRSPASSVRP